MLRSPARACDANLRADTASGRLRRVLVSLIGLATLWAVTPQAASGQVVCLPTCPENDGRFFVLQGGVPSQIIGSQQLVVQIQPPPGQAPSLDIFDGDTGATDGSGDAHWDRGTSALAYELFTDANDDGEGEVLVHSMSGAAFGDNAWTTIAASAASGDAIGSDGHPRYVLVIRTSDPDPANWSAFKVRVAAATRLRLKPQRVSFLAPIGNDADARILHPSYPAATPSTYDGTWDFAFDVPAAQRSVTVWDGDFDHGDSSCSQRDTDDANTPNAVPLFVSGSAARAEGAALADAPTPACGASRPSGDPPDDDLDPAHDLYRRSPSIETLLFDSLSGVYANSNPSGHGEWEQFAVSAEQCRFTFADYCAANAVAGIWRLHVRGMDAGNVNAIFIPFDLVPQRRQLRRGTVSATPVHPYVKADGLLTPSFPTASFTHILPADGTVSFSSTLSIQYHEYAARITSFQSSGDGWQATGYVVKPDPLGTATCSLADAYAGSEAFIPAGSDPQLLCIRLAFEQTTGDRRLRVQVVTNAATHTGDSFSGSITPGGPDQTWAVTLAAGATHSDVAERRVSTAAQTLQRDNRPGWLGFGIAVKPDPDGTASCELTDTFAGSPQVPAGTVAQLMCVGVSNDTSPRRLEIIVAPVSTAHPAHTFTGTIAPGGEATTFSLPFAENASSAGVTVNVSWSEQQVAFTPSPGWGILGYRVNKGCGPLQSDYNDVALIPSGSRDAQICVLVIRRDQRQVRVQVVSPSNATQTEVFVGPITPGGSSTGAWALQLLAGQTHSEIAPRVLTGQAQTIAQYPLAGWTLIGFTVRLDHRASGACSPGDTFTGASVEIPADASDYLVCVRNDFGTPGPRTVRVGVVRTGGQSTGTLSGTFAPGGPDATWGTVLDSTASFFPITRSLSSSAHTVTADPPSSGWAFSGFLVKPDPEGSATCSSFESFAGTTAEVPAGVGRYLVCVLYRGVDPNATRRVRIQKVTASVTHQADVFSGPIAPGGPDTGAWAVGLGENASHSDIALRDLTTAAQTMTESPRPGWALVGFKVKPEGFGFAASCSPTEAYAGTSAEIPAGSGQYLVCVRNDVGTSPVTRTIRFQKVIATASHPFQAFPVAATPAAGAAVSLSLVLPADGASSPIESRTLDTRAYTVTEGASAADWSLLGFTVKSDPQGTAICGVNEPFTGTSASIPADGHQYLVCVRNDYVPAGSPRLVFVQAVTSAASHPGFTSLGNLTPGGPDINYGVVVPGSATRSAPQIRAVARGVAHAVEQAEVDTGWVLAGYHVKPNPTGYAQCELSDVYAATAAARTVPADNVDYLLCVRNERESDQPRLIFVQAVAAATTHPGFTSLGNLTPGGPDINYGVVVPANVARSAAQIRSAGRGIAHTVSQTAVDAGWMLTGYHVKANPTGLAECSPADPYSSAPGANVVPADGVNYLVCVRNQLTPSRSLRVQVVTGVSLHPAESFSGAVNPGNPDNTWSVTMASGVDLSGVSSRQVSTASQTVTVTPTSFWTLVGFVVKPDPDGTAGCTATDGYAGASGTVPASTVAHLVCIRQDYTRTRIVYLQQLTGTVSHPPDTFAVNISPGGPATHADLFIHNGFSQRTAIALNTASHVATQLPVQGWTLVGFTVIGLPPSSGGGGTCPSSGYTGPSATIPSGTQDYLVCIRTDYGVEPPGTTRRLRIQALTATFTHPAQVFSGPVTPGGPATGAWAVMVPLNVSHSDVANRVVTTEQQTIGIGIVADWTLVGFTVKPDPFGTATCSVSESFSGTSVIVPADVNAYLVCVRNDRP